MNPLGHFVIACLGAAALTANAQVSLITQLHPGTNSTDRHFSVSVRSRQTEDGAYFSVTVTPQTSEKLFCRARVMMFDGQGMIRLMSFEEDHEHFEQDHHYEFEVASNLLVSSQFIFRYSSDEGFLKEEGGDAIWFFLKDFAPKAAPNKSLQPTRDNALGLSRSHGLFCIADPAWLSSSR